MITDIYERARKEGVRAYKEALSNNQYPYLQALEEIIAHENTTAEIKLGVVDIPSDAIKGTYTAGRRNSFACNFMPLMQNGTEFSRKWEHIAAWHEKEGIHDPVKAYEYLHDFYIVEGNKRVSVLKYYDAPFVPGDVTRILPVRDNTLKNKVYFEYLDFYQYCPVLFLIFTQLGSYKEFSHFVGKKWGVRWTTDEIMDLKSAFFRFRKAYHEVAGGSINGITTSDVFLCYLHFYSYEAAIKKMKEEFQQDLDKIWDEVLLLTKKTNVELFLEPEEAPKRNLFERFFSADTDRKLKIAFVYLRSPQESPWTYGHELGRQHLMNEYGEQVETWTYENIGCDTIETSLEDAIQKGADIIFATSQIYTEHCNKIAAMHPEVIILNCAVNVACTYIHNYYARTYEAKFLSGVLAGVMAETENIGYLADNPSYGTLADVNAFALGVQSVNPNAKVHLQWVAELDSNPVDYFNQQDVRIISGRDILSKEDNPREFGLYRFHEGKIENLGLTVINWGVFYQKLVESVLNGAIEEAERDANGRAINYWWGFGADVIDIIMSDKVSESTKRMVQFLELGLRNGTFRPFSGKITAQNSELISGDENRVFTPSEIESISWLNENIIGHIPTKETLKPMARILLRVESATEGRANE